MLALLVIATQGAWAQIGELTLYDAADNSTAISTALGNTYNVTLSGRTLYQDGDWNTLCLPFGMDATKIAASPLAGTTIKALDGDNSSLDANGKLTLQFTNATTIEAGKPYIVKWPVVAINDADDWNEMVDNVSRGISYKGKIVKLCNDITVATGDMVGSSTGTAFGGIFDGNGHTITCAIDYTTNEGAAPFHAINNATIMNLKVAGSVRGIDHCAGLVGYAAGTNIIKNCEVTATIEAKVATGNADTYCGGILGNGTSSTTTISNCLFSGSISSSATTHVGIIYGWGDTYGTQTIDHCLANGTYDVTTGTLDMILGQGTLTVTACYKNVNSGSKGTYFSSYSAETLVSGLGSKWEVVGNKAVPKMTAESTITSPVFNGVTINNTTADVSFTGGTDTFKGNYDPLDIDDSNRSDILLLTSGNQLGYAKADLTLNAFRAYFHIPAYPSPSVGVRVRSFALDFGDDEATGIISLTPESAPKGRGKTYIYDLQGRNVTHPIRGVYIVGGRKIFKQ